jgi:hypothetical protein
VTTDAVLVDAIESARERYLEQFRAFVARQRQNCTLGGPEVKFELSEQSGVYKRLYCVDFVKNDDGAADAIELQVDDETPFPTLVSDFRGVTMTVTTVRWDDVVLSHDAGNLPAQALDDWFQYWFDLDDKRLQPDAELSGVIHSLICEPGKLQVDFGTAPARAFWDLLELLKEGNAKSIWIGTSTDAEPNA